MHVQITQMYWNVGTDGFGGQTDLGQTVWFTHFLHMKLKLKTCYLTFPLSEKVRIIVQPTLQSGYAD